MAEEKTLPSVRNNLSLVPFRVRARFNDTTIGHATGFMYRHSSGNYLVTNWHVLTGRHPETGQPTDEKTCAVPNYVNVMVPFRRQESDKPVMQMWWEEWPVALYADADHRNARWFEHPTHGRNIDVAAIPLDIEKEHIGIIAANDEGQLGLNAVVLYPPLSVYVLGYPLGLAGGLHLPIWKRGTIANEPELLLDGLPKIYIDTATRKGMSGAPVFVDEGAGWTMRQPDGSTVMQLGGRGRKLVGIYASRLVGTEFEAQLGVVWKTEAIDELIAGQKLGPSSFFM